MKNPQPFAVFDIDGTLIRWQMLHAIFDRLGREGQLLEGDYADLLAARQDWKNRKADEGFRAYESVLVSVAGRNLARIAVKDFQRAADDVFAEYKDQTYRYTRRLIGDLKQKGYCLLAISGSPDEIVKHLARHYEFDDYAATIHHQKDGRFTGEIMVAALHKPELLKQLVAKHGLTFTDSIGMGDSEGDISMLEMTEHPLAFNPSKILFQQAQKQGWKVVIERKNMIYELEPADGHYRLAHTNAEE